MCEDAKKTCRERRIREKGGESRSSSSLSVPDSFIDLLSLKHGACCAWPALPQPSLSFSPSLVRIHPVTPIVKEKDVLQMPTAGIPFLSLVLPAECIMLPAGDMIKSKGERRRGNREMAEKTGGSDLFFSSGKS